ncbi:MAG: carbonic anhydrase [Halorhodospira sp.]
MADAVLEAEQALARLRAGNRRFTADGATPSGRVDAARRAELRQGQRPFAAVLACADSRVPPELVFEQGLGELFVTRVAGNIATPSQLGSLEFAAEELGVRLVVVLGHTGCGAVGATLQALRASGPPPSEGLRTVVDGVRPAVAPLLGQGLDEAALRARAERENVRHACRTLREGSPVLARLRSQAGLAVLGAAYSLETGEVAFFDGVTEAGALPPPAER